MRDRLPSLESSLHPRTTVRPATVSGWLTRRPRCVPLPCPYGSIGVTYPLPLCIPLPGSCFDLFCSGLLALAPLPPSGVLRVRPLVLLLCRQRGRGRPEGRTDGHRRQSRSVGRNRTGIFVLFAFFGGGVALTCGCSFPCTFSRAPCRLCRPDPVVWYPSVGNDRDEEIELGAGKKSIDITSLSRAR